MITTKVNQVVERFTNQYFYSEPVGVYLINLKETTLLFDIPTYSDEIRDYLLEKNKPVIALLSHGSCGIKDGAVWQKSIGLKVYLHKADQHHAWLNMQPDIYFSHMPDFDNNFKIIHTPGHSPGSICLLEQSTSTLFTGDTVGGDFDGTIRDFTKEDQQHDDTPQRLMSCKNLLEYEFQSILPFHYEMILENGKEKLERYLSNT